MDMDTKSQYLKRLEERYFQTRVRVFSFGDVSHFEGYELSNLLAVWHLGCLIGKIYDRGWSPRIATS